MMRVLEGDFSTWQPEAERSSVTIGVLDGVHLGHQALVANLDRGFVPTVLTFEPHPIEILRPGTHPRLITTVHERIERLEQLGVRQVGLLNLAEIKHLSAEEFVSDVLVGVLSVGQVVVGPDFRFGRDRAGHVEVLHRTGRRHGFKTTVIDSIDDGLGAVSSSRIREMIETGRLADAEKAMGARYRLSGTVVAGDRRGREIGYPTANLRPPPRKVLPATGVYAAFVRTGGATHKAAVNVGIRPTFGGGELLIEPYLLDFSGDLYDRELTVEFVAYLRPELSFHDVDDLVAEIDSDVDSARKLLARTASNMG